VGQEISDLNPSEQQWVGSNVELAGEIAKGYGLAVEPGDSLDPQMLDTAWASWLVDHVRGEEDPNPYINAFGVAFGDHLLRRLGLEWKIVEDKHGTEMAVWGHEGDVLVFPLNLVGKRYVDGTTTFFADVAGRTEESVTRIRGQIGDSKSSGFGRFFRGNR
jgi:hypothetical protein